MEKNKVIIIGIDVATFDIILPGKLVSIHPSHTVPAWVACATGVNPGKIGLFDFCKDSHLTYDEGSVADSVDIKAKPIWNIK